MLEQYDRVAKSYATRQRLRRNDAADEDETDDDDLAGNAGNGQRHLVDVLADLLVEAGSSDGEVTREQALRWLLHSKEGQSLIARLAPYRKQIETACRKRVTHRKDSTMTRSEHLSAVIKRAGGVEGLCKRIVKRGDAGDISEAELTGMIIASAKAEYPHLTSEAAFAKVFSAPDGEVLRRATQLAMFTQLYGAK
jgi:hypothetical protein